MLVTASSDAGPRALEAGRPRRYGPRRVRAEAGPRAVERKRPRLGRPGQPLTDRPDLLGLRRCPVQRVPGPGGELVLVLPPPGVVGRDDQVERVIGGVHPGAAVIGPAHVRLL